MLPRTLSALVLGAVLLGSAPPAAPAQDSALALPLLRWSHPSASALPRSIAFSGAGELVWSAFSGLSSEVALFPSAPQDLPAQPLFHETGALAGAIGKVQVACGDEPSELFALVQLPGPVAPLRRTLVLGFDALAAARGDAFAPRWTHDLDLLVNAPGLLASSADGATLVAALADAALNLVRVDWLDAAGNLVERTELASSALKALALAPEGNRAALCVGLELVVLAPGSGSDPLLELDLRGATSALALSGDARLVAHGDLGEVRVLEEGSAGYTALATFTGGASELPVALALSADGETLAITWWDFGDGTSVRLDVVDVRTGAVLNAHEQRGASAGLQNFPSALRMSPDGARIALGLWGAGDARPELLLFERGVPEPRLAVDLPGSVEALDLDRSGTRVAVACKDAHANVFAATGSIARYDTGERPLELVRSARPGGTLELVLAAEQPLRGALFVLGLGREVPVVLPGRGTLLLDLAAPHFSFAGTIGPADRASAVLSVPSGPVGASLIGLPLGIQVVTFGTGGWRLVSELVQPAIL